MNKEALNEWREDADPNKVVLAVGKCLGAVMDKSQWLELGLLTGSAERLTSHPRLLRALSWGDDDYQGCVYEVVPWMLGEHDGIWPVVGLSERFPHLSVVSGRLGVPAWLLEHEPAIHAQVCTGPSAGLEAKLPDGTVLDAADTAAGRLGVAEMQRQMLRIRRDYADDPEALLGQVKDFAESTCKTILGITGSESEAQREMSELMTGVLRRLGLHAGERRKSFGRAEAEAPERFLGALATMLDAVPGLRNKRGSGHGRSRAPLVDAALARMVVGMTLSAMVYLCDVYESETSTEPGSPAGRG